MSRTAWYSFKNRIRKALEVMLEDDKIDESELLHPGDDIPEGKFIYLINNSPSNKKMMVNGIKTVLTAPGTEGSVQAVNTDVLLNPAIIAMWTRNDILVTASQKAQQKAISNIAIRDRNEKNKIAELRSKVVNVIPGHENSRGEDVSYKVRNIANTIKKEASPSVKSASTDNAEDSSSELV